MEARPRKGPARRARQTVRFDRPTFMALLEAAVEGEATRQREGRGALVDATEAAQVDGAAVREPLLALLKSFTDAANRRGGLRTDDHGSPAELPLLLQRGRDNARAGNTQPKLLSRVRAGHAVDMKSAMAALHFFRLVLARPGLTLDQIGAVENRRLKALHSVLGALQRVREQLPVDILQGLVSRAEEAAGYAVVQDRARVHYEGFVHFVDGRGVHRLRVRRRFSYRPLRLSEYPGVVSTSLALEWHECQREVETRLVIHLLDENGEVLRSLSPPLRKRIDGERGVVLIEVPPAELAALQGELVLPGAPQRHHSHEVCWQQTLVFNAADRDIIVSYQPVNGLQIQWTPPDDGTRLRFAVGDSPGLRRAEGGWMLDRALLPREVLAVRFRLDSLDDAEASRLSPSGEWCGPSAG